MPEAGQLTGLAPETLGERRRRLGLDRREKTRNLLVQAAIRVVAARGVEAPVIDDFIAAAGVSRGSFYNHFKTREALFTALVEWLQQNARESADLAASQLSDPAERLVCGVRYLIRRSSQDPDWGWLVVRFRADDAATRAWFRIGPRADIQRGVDAGRLKVGDIEVAADMLIGALHEAVRTVVDGHASEDLPEQVAAFILAGLGLPYEEAHEVARRPLPSIDAFPFQASTTQVDAA
jgi:AcrR family transcriptional regulator